MKRNINLDIIRTIALISVISIHFPLHIGFYSIPVTTFPDYVMCLIVMASQVCVPLFLLLTGYLKSNCTLSKNYYKGIVKIYGIYLIASVACVIYRKIAEIRGIKYAFTDILGFKASGYAWYINMYIGLFLLIPFLNLIYQNLTTKKRKQLLIVSCLFCTAAPSIFNIWSFENMPLNSENYTVLIPSFWVLLYPVTYYFIGAYLKEYGCKLKVKYALGGFVFCVILFGIFNICRSYPYELQDGLWNDWGSFENTVTAVLLFIGIHNISTNHIPKILQRVIIRISNLSLYAYLVSYIFDHLFYYKMLNANIPIVQDRYVYYPVMVVTVLGCSLILSLFLYFIYMCMTKCIIKLESFLLNRREKV